MSLNEEKINKRKDTLLVLLFVFGLPSISLLFGVIVTGGMNIFLTFFK